MNQRPIPFDEASVKKCWKPDPFDKVIPSKKGFVSDFILALRGHEVPVAYSYWCALWCIAAMVKREAWIRWGPGRLFPSFYIFLSGPPSSKKGTAIDLAVRVFKNAMTKLTERHVEVMKTHMAMVFDQITPQALAKQLMVSDGLRPGKRGWAGIEKILQDNEGNVLKHPNGEIMVYRKTSEAAIVAEELSTMLGKQKYNEGLITLLLAIFNTKEEHEVTTLTHGVLRLENLCTNFLAGTTPSAFRDSIAESAKGDGFLSRLVIAHQDGKHQRFHRPVEVEGLPTEDDLAERLAYIAEVGIGEFDFSEDADKLYSMWYDKIHDDAELQTTQSHFASRRDVHLVRTSLLMHLQSYPPEASYKIDVDSMLDAIRSIDATFKTSPKILQEVGREAQWSQVERISEYIQKRKRVLRTRLMQSTHIFSDELTKILLVLQSLGRIKVSRGGHFEDNITSKGTEQYVWNEDYKEDDSKREVHTQPEDQGTLLDWDELPKAEHPISTLSDGALADLKKAIKEKGRKKQASQRGGGVEIEEPGDAPAADEERDSGASSGETGGDSQHLLEDREEAPEEVCDTPANKQKSPHPARKWGRKALNGKHRKLDLQLQHLEGSDSPALSAEYGKEN